jgi:acyl-CoA synthetase (AMP-forming)/AMP-acid ligase II/pimeloyl-ACP methyl ester carboxylesterase
MLQDFPWTIDAARLFLRAARRFANRTALIWEEGEMTYSTLLDRTRRLASALRGLDVRTGDRVALLFPNGPEFIEAWWAAVYVGAVSVPLSTRAVKEELVEVIRDCAPKCVLVHERWLELLLRARAELPLDKIIACSARPPSGVISYEELITNGKEFNATEPIELNAPCAIYYTTGTTGKPKGAVRSHLSVAWGLALGAQRLEDKEVYLGRAPMYHTGGSLTGPFATLVCGGTLVTLSRVDPERLLRAVERYRVTRLYLHPTHVAKSIFHLLDRSHYDLSSVRYLHWTAGPLPEAVRDEIFRRFPRLPLEVTYGMTEVSNIASIDYEGSANKSASCVGYPWPGSEIAIASEDNHLLPVGAEGEVVVRSPTLMTEYWKDSDQTNLVMEGGWFHTGDLGMLDQDGALFLTGRKKDMIKTGGMAVRPQEVENVLASHPDVMDVAVIGLPDEEWEEAVIAVVVAKTNAHPSAEQLIAHCKEHMASHKAPKRIIFAAELPKTGVKVNKKELMTSYGSTTIAPGSLWLEVNALRLHVLKWEGKGVPVILIHGTGLLARLWEPLAQELAVKIGPVYAFDLRGHGVSDKPARGYRWELFAEDIAAAVDQLKLMHPIVIGHSMGATVAMILAAIRPELVGRLVAIEAVIRKPDALAAASKSPHIPSAEKALRRKSTWHSYDELWTYLKSRERYASWRPEVLDLFARFGVEQDGSGKITLLCRPEIEAQMYLERQFLNPWSYFPKIPCPTLLIYSDKKRDDVMAEPEEVARAIAGAQVARQRGDHFLPYENPQALLTLVESFLLSKEETV